MAAAAEAVEPDLGRHPQQPVPGAARDRQRQVGSSEEVPGPVERVRPSINPVVGRLRDCSGHWKPQPGQVDLQLRQERRPRGLQPSSVSEF